MNIIKFIIEDVGIDVNVRDMCDLTPLHVACRFNQVDIVKYLIENNADIHAKSESGLTPIQSVAKNIEFTMMHDKKDITDYINKIIFADQ